MALTKAHNRMIASSPANIKDFGAVGDGVADDATAIQLALDSGADTIIIPDGNYRIATSLEINSANISVIGQGGFIILDGSSVNGFNTGYANTRFENLYIKSPVTGTRNGFYGLNIRTNADYCSVINCTFEDVRYNAILTDTSFSTFTNIVTKNCGWDSIVFFGNATDNYATNIYSYRSGRSAIGADENSARNVVDGLVVIDNGDPNETTQHHDVIHFEGCIDSVYKNVEIFYTTNHPAASTGLTDVNAAIRFNKGSGCKVDNVRVVYDTSCSASLDAIVCDQNPDGVTISNFVVENNTTDLIEVLIDFDGTFPTTVTFDGMHITGPIRLVNNAIDEAITVNFRGCSFNNVTNSTHTDLYYSPQRSSNTHFKSCTFDGCEVVFNAAGWRSSSITDCFIKDVSDTVFKTYAFSFTSSYRPRYGVITNNIFSGTIAKCFDFYQGEYVCAVTSNVFNGTITTMVQSNGVAGGVGSTNSRFKYNMVTGTVTTMDSALDADANQ